MRSPLIWLGSAVAVLAFAWAALALLSSFGAAQGDTALWVLAVSALIGIAAAIYLSGERRAGAPRQGALDRTPIWKYVILGLLPMVVLAVGGAIYALIGLNSTAAEAPIVVLLFAGVAGLLLALAVVAVFFAALGLNDQREALGLPRGSIRAVIAIALILIFAALSVYLHSTVDEAAAANDLAGQLITTVSTLVVAIASFYFGSSSVQTATESLRALRGSSDLIASPPDPLPKLTKNAEGVWEPDVVTIGVTTEPPGMEVSATVYGDEPQSLAAAGGGFEYRPRNPTPPVLIRFALVDEPDVQDEVTLTGDDASGSAGATVAVSTTAGRQRRLKELSRSRRTILGEPFRE